MSSSSNDVNRPSLGHVTVIGGCGFLGHHIVSLLHSRYPTVSISIIDLRTSSAAKRVVADNITYHDGDITSYDDMKRLFKELRPTVVIHTASPQAHLGKELQWKVNVEGTRNLVKVAEESNEVGEGVKAFVYTGSASVVCKRGQEVVNANEEWPVIAGKDQPDYYSSTKAWAEQAVLEANRRHRNDFLTVALRPAGIFGPGDQQILPRMIAAYFDSGADKVQIGSNENLFDYTYVVNVAHAHLLAAQALVVTASMPTTPLDTEKVDGEPFFITNDSPVYFWDFSRAVWKECGAVAPLRSIWTLSREFMYIVAYAMGALGTVGLKTKSQLTSQSVYYSTMQKWHSIDKAKRRLGYKPLVSLETGIKEGVKVCLEEGGWGKEGVKKNQ